MYHDVGPGPNPEPPLLAVFGLPKRVLPSRDIRQAYLEVASELTETLDTVIGAHTFSHYLDTSQFAWLMRPLHINKPS